MVLYTALIHLLTDTGLDTDKVKTSDTELDKGELKTSRHGLGHEKTPNFGHDFRHGFGHGCPPIPDEYGYFDLDCPLEYYFKHILSSFR